MRMTRAIAASSSRPCHDRGGSPSKRGGEEVVGEEVLHSGDGRTTLPANVLRKKPSQHLRTLPGRDSVNIGFSELAFFF